MSIFARKLYALLGNSFSDSDFQCLNSEALAWWEQNRESLEAIASSSDHINFEAPLRQQTPAPSPIPSVVRSKVPSLGVKTSQRFQSHSEHNCNSSLIPVPFSAGCGDFYPNNKPEPIPKLSSPLNTTSFPTVPNTAIAPPSPLSPGQ